MTNGAKSGSVMDGLDHELKSKPSSKAASDGSDWKRVAVPVFAAASLLVLLYVLWSSYSGYVNSPQMAARYATVKDSVTGEVINKFPMESGKTFPYVNPKTGQPTLYPTEACFWTKDGKAKLEPTHVILNESMGKTGTTNCPDCGRRVVRFNPMPPDKLMQEAWEASERK